MQSKPLPFSPFPPTPADYSLSEGDQGFAVTAVQYLLEALSVIYPIKTVEITGIYDENTKDAISEIQARYLLPVTGKTDKLTWNALVRLYDSLSLYE
jgi:peptidoglycan hydrolase-like protein with peptidoglycan-binding domain